MSSKLGQTALSNLESMACSQAAATIVLAAAMLRGGTPTQQSQAEAFIASELAKHDKDLTGQLVARLKDTVEVDEDGIWVSETMGCFPFFCVYISVCRHCLSIYTNVRALSSRPTAVTLDEGR